MSDFLDKIGLSPEQGKAFEVFFPYAFKKTSDAVKRQQRFVHYTSAETALNIFRNREFWMRKPSCMNDFMELEYGFNFLKDTIKCRKNQFENTLDSIFPNFCQELYKLFNDWLPMFRKDTYIACFSEHDNDEDQFGRLSMWRAYGGRAGVALVLHGQVFVKSNDVLRVYSSPVAYFTRQKFEAEFDCFVKNIAQNSDFLRSFGKQQVFSYVFEVFRSAMLCTKHPGFHEEREWRLIYSPNFEKSNHIIEEVQTVGGTPQLISKIPLTDIPNEGLIGIEIPQIIDRVIIGPTQYPNEISDAFDKALSDAGVRDAHKRIILSDIPLRN